MKATTKRTDDKFYRGAVLEGSRVLCVCTHKHRNRDNDSWDYRVKGYIDGMSALTCANKLMTTMDAQTPDEITELLEAK